MIDRRPQIRPPAGPSSSVRPPSVPPPRLRTAPAALLLALVTLLMLLPTTAAQSSWEHETPVRFSDGVDGPVDIAFGRDGYLYYAALMKTAVLRVDLETGETDDGFVLDLPNATWENGSETGVFGLALDPDFASNGIMYVSYSRNESGEWTNVLSRVTLKDASGAATEEVLLTRPGNLFHNGGRVLIADGHLWWTTGDASNPFEKPPEEAGLVSQQDGDLRGKVLRLTLDGGPAPDNPWGDAAYTKGHRNVYGIAWDPENQRMIVTENGNARADYAYILESGANYGWPYCEGACEEPDPKYTDPIWQSEGTVAPTGAAWFRGAYWFGTFNQGDIMRLADTSGDWQVEKVHHYPGTEKLPPRVLDVEVGPDGQSLWFSAWSEIWRIDFAEDAAHPAVAAMADGPFWWNGTALGERAPPQDDEAPETTGGIPAPGVAALLGTLAAALVVARRR